MIRQRQIQQRLIRGAMAGLKATVPMTGLMKAGFHFLPREEQYSLPPRQVTMQIAEAGGVRRRLTERQKSFLTMLSHFAYGAAVGAVYSLLVGRRRSSRAKGAAYGILVWIGSYLGLLPALGLLKPATRHPVHRNLLMIVAHLVWGAALGGSIRKAQRRSYQFRGRTVVIMGGSRGLGLELARQWIVEGAKVAICARTKADLQRAHQELERQGGEVFSAKCDIASQEEVESFLQKVADHWGPIDVLVNNAGVIQVGPLDCMTEDDYRTAMDTHYWGPVFAINTVLPAMRRRGSGRIVNISSIGGKISVPHLLPYSAGKFALAGYSEGLATELEQQGIFVTTVYPGLMRTGSPRNALFKGQHRKEYAWFSISDSLPLLSVNSARAARQIVEACRRGDSQLEISLVCKAAVRVSALFPRLTTSLLRIVNFWLPRPGGIGSRSKLGKESTSQLTPSVLTRLSERAAQKNNELREPHVRKSGARRGS
jgi:NAD(P)-dependent dehydrogenase (short-subunit alcohol dehydrogenase family)/uncharacterized membrane protein YagU involved in acid resistance